MIRKATLSDVSTITALVHRAVRQSNRLDYSQEEIDHLLNIFSPDHIGRKMAIRTVLVALIDAKIAGTVSLDRDRQQLHMLFVDPHFQGKGIGAALLSEVERLARVADILKLQVRSSRTAVGFYQARGYVIDGPEGGDIATLPMIKSLVV